MGRRDRERIQTIIEGRAVSIREKRDILGHEVVRLASEHIFNDAETDEMSPSDGSIDEHIAKAVTDVLPEALCNTGIRMFSVADLTRKKEWLEHWGRVVKGCLARTDTHFRMWDRKGDVWKARKGPQGRKRTGTWCFCLFCGDAFYAPPSSKQRWHTRECYFAWRRREKQLALTRRDGEQQLVRDGAVYEERVLQRL